MLCDYLFLGKVTHPSEDGLSREASVWILANKPNLPLSTSADPIDTLRSASKKRRHREKVSIQAQNPSPHSLQPTSTRRQENPLPSGELQTVLHDPLHPTDHAFTGAPPLALAILGFPSRRLVAEVLPLIRKVQRRAFIRELDAKKSRAMFWIMAKYMVRGFGLGWVENQTRGGHDGATDECRMTR